MKKQIILSLLLVISFSCQKTDECGTNSPSIIGTWVWTKSVGGFGGGTITPEMTGEKIEISFSIDSVFKEYLNNSLITESKFSLAFKDPNRRPYLNYIGLIDQFYDFTNCNNLILTDMASDGYVNYYKRKQKDEHQH